MLPLPNQHPCEVRTGTGKRSNNTSTYYMQVGVECENKIEGFAECSQHSARASGAFALRASSVSVCCLLVASCYTCRMLLLAALFYFPCSLLGELMAGGFFGVTGILRITHMDIGTSAHGRLDLDGCTRPRHHGHGASALASASASAPAFTFVSAPRLTAIAFGYYQALPD